MRLLIADLARRNSRRAAFFFGLLAIMLWMSGETGDPGLAFGISMAIAWLGPQLILQPVPRAIWYLPMSRRDVWRGGWLVATVGTTLFTTAAKLVALMAFPAASYGLGRLVLSSLYDVGTAGAACGLVIVATWPRPARSPWRQVSPLFRGLAEFALPLSLPAALLGSSYIPTVLPTHWADVTVWSGTGLAAALVVTIGTYFHSPAPPSRLIQSLMFRSASPPAGPPRTGHEWPRLEFARLSGLPRLLVHEYLWTLLIGGSLAVAAGLVVLVGANILHSQETFAGFLRSELLLLDATVTPQNPLGFEAFALLIWYAFFAASLAARFPTMLRHLRVLPLDASQVNALLVAWPAVVWLTVWTGLLALGYVVVGAGFASFDLAWFVGLVGFSAIIQALTLRLAGPVRLLVFSVAVGAVPLLSLLRTPPPAVLAGLGLVCLAAAAGLNHVALKRSSTYKHPGSPFAPPLTG